METKVIKKRAGIQQKRLRENIFYACAVALPLLNFIVFFIGVNFNTILLAFKEYTKTDTEDIIVKFYWFNNFVEVFKNLKGDDVVRCALKNSAFVYFFNLLIQLPICLCSSYYIYKKCLGSEFFKIVLFLPSIISSIVLTLTFRYVCDVAVPELLNYWGIRPKKFSGLISDHDTAFMSILLYNTVIGFGGGIILYTGTMSGISESVVESCRLEGAGVMQEFFYITLPLIYPMLSVGLITGVAGVLTADIGLYAYFGSGSVPGKLYTMGYYLYRETLHASVPLDYPYLSALGLTLTAVAVPLTYVVKYILEKIDPNN